MTDGNISPVQDRDAVIADSITNTQAENMSPRSSSKVPGKSFDRFVIIWLENADFEDAKSDPNLADLARRGMVLDNLYAVAKPSQPNYIASHGGDIFGLDHDRFITISSSIATVFDLLDTKNISWAEYQEDMPSTGFLGERYDDPTTGLSLYRRKHNPGISYESVSLVDERLQRIKDLKSFYDDLNNDVLPQWMFITPNMQNNGHDTDVPHAGKWTKEFLDPLLQDSRFMERTLVLLTFDENETWEQPNKILGILLGDAIPKELVGTTDSAYYDHYSQISTVSANWDLPTLGRHDVEANVYSVVAASTGDQIQEQKQDPGRGGPGLTFKRARRGPLSRFPHLQDPWWAVPNTNYVRAGRSVLSSVVDTCGSQVYRTPYSAGGGRSRRRLATPTTSVSDKILDASSSS